MMRGTVFPRPHKWAIDRRGRRYKAPVRKGERYQVSSGEWRIAANDSTWSWQVTTGSKRRGNRKTHKKGGYRTKQEAQTALAEALAALGKGDTRPLARADGTLLGDYLYEWLDDRKDSLKPSTFAGYRDAIRAWIAPKEENDSYRGLPYVGGIPLCDVGSEQLLRLYAHLREQGGRITKSERNRAAAEGREPVGGPLGTRSVHLAHTVLNMALADAAEEKVPYNPVDRIPKRRRPKHKAKKQVDRFWTPEQAKAFLEATSQSRLHALWSTELDTGARRGEQSAFRWEHLDLQAGTATIQQNRVLVDGEPVEGTTKSSKTRTVGLDRRTVTALKAWRAQQAKERIAAGPGWVGGVPGKTGYVWTNELGEVYRPDWLSDEFERAQRGLDLPRLVFHGLRHTSATIALASGVPVHVVSARLGHANVSITLDLYAHVIPGQDADAAQAIGDAIYGKTGTEDGS